MAITYDLADAVVRGLERRAPRIFAPRFWAAVKALRGGVNAAGDLVLDRDTTAQRMIRSVEDRARRARERGRTSA